MEQNCNEQFLEDLVRVDLVPTSECDFSVPFTIAGIISMPATKTVGGQSVSRIGTPALTLAYTMTDDGEGEMDASPTLRQSEKTTMYGTVVTHELQAPVVSNYESMRTSVNGLHSKDFHMVLTMADGTRYLCYSVPNGSDVTLEEQNGEVTEQTVKVTLKSLSHIIRLE